MTIVFRVVSAKFTRKYLAPPGLAVFMRRVLASVSPFRLITVLTWRRPSWAGEPTLYGSFGSRSGRRRQ